MILNCLGMAKHINMNILSFPLFHFSFRTVCEMRQYEPIWEKLKSLPLIDAKLKGVSITAPAALHKRIIKAVKKEKWMDFGYKMMLKELDDREATLSYSRKASILTFKLRFSIGIKDL